MAATTDTYPAEKLRAFSVHVVQRLVDAGYRAVFAGGSVRDMLLGKQPHDFDVATAAPPEAVLKLFPRAIPVGVAFGVVRVLSEDDPPIQVEIATFRGETSYSDGRHPDKVNFTDEKEDVRRRDFTVNGLLFDPLKNEVLDYVDGRRDLELKRLRAIGDPKLRFAEDHLRMLRAVRFAAKLGFEIDGATMGAIKENAEKILKISAERIREELCKMLTGPDPRKALELLKTSRLLKYILPEIDVMEGVQQPPEFHPEGDVWVHTLMLLGQLSDAPLTLALGALFHDVGKPPTFVMADRIRFNQHEHVGADMTRAIMERLKFSNDEIEQVVSLVKQHMVYKDVKRMKPSTLKRFLRQPHFDEHMALHKLDCMASHRDLTSYEFCKEKLATIKPEALAPAPLLTGQDLIALGYKPGPKFKEILKSVEDKQLEGELSDRDAAVAYVKAVYEK
jgi:poly(A) polymerase